MYILTAALVITLHGAHDFLVISVPLAKEVNLISSSSQAFGLGRTQNVMSVKLL